MLEDDMMDRNDPKETSSEYRGFSLPCVPLRKLYSTISIGGMLQGIRTTNLDDEAACACGTSLRDLHRNL